MTTMQTLPFLVAKTPTMKTTVEPVDTKKSAEKGAVFKEVMSKQIAQENAKKSLGDKADKVLPEGELQDGSEQNIATIADEVVVEIDQVDAQLLASGVTAKTIKDATDGNVVLAESSAAVVEVANGVQIPLASTVPAAQSSTKNVAVDTTVDLDGSPTSLANAKAEIDTKATDATTQQKTNAFTEREQGVNEKFVQNLVAETKLKTSQEPVINKSLSGVADVSAMATASLQQPAAVKVSATPVQSLGSSNNINAYPGKTGWNEAVGQKLVWMVGAAEQSAKLTLNPPALGPLEVIINVNNDKADATFISENPEVRKALEDGVSTLRQLMGQAGVELGQANVNTSKQHQAFQQANREQLANQHATDGSESQLEETMRSGGVISRESNGLVDTFA